MSCQDSSLQVLNIILLASLKQSITYLKILQNVIILIILILQDTLLIITDIID